MKKNGNWLKGALLALGAYALLKNPHCKHGCRTVAEHVMNYGIDDVLDVVLA